MSTPGDTVDLGLVGTPVGAAPGRTLLAGSRCKRGYVPIVACVGATAKGDLLNVNADTLASHLAVGLRASRLVIAGGTPGVLDAEGRTIARLTREGRGAAGAEGTANKGMVAKLQACRDAVRGGVGDVVIGNGRDAALHSTGRSRAVQPNCTQVVR